MGQQELSKDKCQILQLGRNPSYKLSLLGYQQGATLWETTEVLVDKMNVSQQCVLASKAESFLGCINRSNYSLLLVIF